MASDLLPRGHLIVKSHTPLPRFACAVPVPHPDATIDQLRTTIVAILTGQVSAKSTSSESKMGLVSGQVGVKTSDEKPLSYSEHLKQLTIHEWRTKSLILELRQNSLIAPETRGTAATAATAVEEGDNSQDDEIRGFELLDDHECSLLEHGDEVNLWLRPGQALESLRLPRLSSKHVYGLPNQPALDRSGTMLLGDNAASNSDSPSEFKFTSPAPIVREPMEPSSHSSSVSANPDINFETTNRHWTVPNQQHRIVTVRQLSNGNNLATATNNHKKPARPLPKEKTKRLGSSDYFSPQLIEQKQKDKYASQRSRSGPIKTVAAAAAATSASQSPELILTNIALVISSPEAKSPIEASPKLSPRAILSPDPPLNDGSEQHSRRIGQPSSPNFDQSDAIASQLKARQASYIRKEKQQRESKMHKAVGQKRMPSAALIVGPGVQGKVGNLPSSDVRNGGAALSEKKPDRKKSGSENRSDSYGNGDAFVSFTATSSEAYKPVRPHIGKARRQSSRSEVSTDKEKGDRMEGRRPSERRQSSFGKLVERKQSETNINTLDQVDPQSKIVQSTSHTILQPLLRPLIRPSASTSKAQAIAPVSSSAPAITTSDFADNPSTKEASGLAPTPAPAPTNSNRRFLDILPPMPMPRIIRTASLSKSWQDLLQPLSGPFTPQTPSTQVVISPVEEVTSPDEAIVDDDMAAVIASRIDVHPSLALFEDGPTSNSPFQDTASSTQRQESIFSTPLEEEVTASLSSADPAAIINATSSSLPLSKAEKRYQEVMKSIEAEREKQSQDEKLRKEATIQREVEKQKMKLKLEEDQEKRKETLKWQMWEEVRARQEKDKDRRR